MASPRHDVNGTHAPAVGERGKAKKPYVRVVTDKRREQNRRAQKIYRERLKDRLETLEGQAGITSKTRLETRPSQHKSGSGGRSGRRLEETSVSRGVEARPSAAISASERSKAASHIINLDDAFVAAGDLPIPQDMSVAGLRFDVAPTPPAEEPEDEMAACDDYGDIDLRPIWAVPSLPSNKSSVLRPGWRHRKQAITLLTPQRTPVPQDLTTPRSLADPLANHLQLSSLNAIEASLSIAGYLRITRSSYINDHPSSFPSCFVALNSDTNGPRSITYSFSDSSHMTVTPQLRDHMSAIRDPFKPSPAQLTAPHPSYLDCIVFPHFRDLAVQATAQGILDHEQLWTDILNGGLVCWGGAAGLGHSRRAPRRQMGDDVAWNPRSWEAKRWFLRKWAWVLGTEQEEEERRDAHGIWKVSRWWWGMRGDGDSEDDGDVEDEYGMPIPVPSVQRTERRSEGLNH